MRTLVIGDIHGGLRAVEQAFERAGVTVRDQLIFLGDYVDGWSESPQVLDLLLSLQQTHRCIFIRGNHDALLLEWLKGNNDNLLWYKHGGEATVKAYRNVSDQVKLEHIGLLEKLENYYLDARNRLFVHAGFTNLNGVAYEYFPKMFFWERTLWETALALDPKMSRSDPAFPKRFTLYKEIYIGHTPVTRIGQTVPANRDCVWNVDTGAAFKGPLTVMDVDTKAYWQSDPLPELYLGEKGRNN
ncbi:MAG: serine/threonine protein phosphatase [Flavobacterium sp. BFFFF1]|uniref:metallophosphoesterase family protein n=1 Tax=Flavobacterium sp. BFFFF1 TaxID=2015557 RepID=UPI000BCCFB06|nr:metallophosphoesterase family protein [Flavobacterium sp. BFFFF1]OYU82338.1 MAG: serine/threonine protein phosphatase [Flavobacterium sp. BFFFF1]